VADGEADGNSGVPFALTSIRSANFNRNIPARCWCRCSRLSYFLRAKHLTVGSSMMVHTRSLPHCLSELILSVLLRMIRRIVLNDTNFRTIMHHIHKLKEHRYDPLSTLSYLCSPLQQCHCVQDCRRSNRYSAFQRGEPSLD
jgi:hypothetical protein